MNWIGLRRALRRRCPMCGERDVFASWGTMRESCPGCGHRFEREEGYWVGAMIVNLGVAESLFMAWFVGGLALTYPDVPWTTLLVVGAALGLLLPVWLYPRSKTLWVWLDDQVHPYEVDERPDRR